MPLSVPKRCMQKMRRSGFNLKALPLCCSQAGIVRVNEKVCRNTLLKQGKRGTVIKPSRKAAHGLLFGL